MGVGEKAGWEGRFLILGKLMPYWITCTMIIVSEAPLVAEHLFSKYGTTTLCL